MTSKTVSYLFIPDEITLEQHKDHLTITSPESLLPLSIEIYTVDGKKVYATQMDKPILNLSLENWNDGIYIVKTGERFLGKIVKPSSH